MNHYQKIAETKAKNARVRMLAKPWPQIQNDYDNGLDMRECSEKYGIHAAMFSAAKKEGLFKPRPQYSSVRQGKRPSMSDAQREKLSVAMSERIKRNVRYSQQVEYNGIVLDSSWELKLAKSLDENNVEWIRPNALKWTDDQGKTRRYLPDFYLPDLEVYLEPKNIYLQKKDELKIKSASLQNKVKIILLLEEQCDWNVVKTML